MSDEALKRYEPQEDVFGDCYMRAGMEEVEDGNWVAWDDYETLLEDRNQQYAMKVRARGERDHLSQCLKDKEVALQIQADNVKRLVDALKWFRSITNATPENDKVRAGCWVSSKHPRIKQIDGLIESLNSDIGDQHEPDHV